MREGVVMQMCTCDCGFRCSDDEQPKPKPYYHIQRSSILSDTPQLIPAEDVSSDEDHSAVSWHIVEVMANAVYTFCSIVYRLQLRSQTARIVRHRFQIACFQ